MASKQPKKTKSSEDQATAHRRKEVEKAELDESKTDGKPKTKAKKEAKPGLGAEELSNPDQGKKRVETKESKKEKEKPVKKEKKAGGEKDEDKIKTDRKTKSHDKKGDKDDEVKHKPTHVKGSAEHKPKAGPNNQLKVVSMNINGGNVVGEHVIKVEDPEEEPEIVVSAQPSEDGTGTTVARHALVFKIVQELDADVLLLQETKSKILINDIIAAGRATTTEREYKQAKQVQKDKTKTNPDEALVLYDEKIFNDEMPQQQQQQQNEEVPTSKEQASSRDKPSSTGREEDCYRFFDAIDRIPEGKRGCERLRERVKINGESVQRRAGAGQVAKERTSSISLQLKGYNRQLIFLSFHNHNDSDNENTVIVFCKAVAAMAEKKEGEEQVYVVAGGDFNCNLENIHQETLGEGIHIPDYEMTERRIRKKKEKIDFFVTKPAVPGIVEAYDATADGGAARKLEGKPIKTRRSELLYKFTAEAYDAVLDHDPLVLTLTLPDPPIVTKHFTH